MHTEHANRSTEKRRWTVLCTCLGFLGTVLHIHCENFSFSKPTTLAFHISGLEETYGLEIIGRWLDDILTPLKSPCVLHDGFNSSLAKCLQFIVGQVSINPLWHAGTVMAAQQPAELGRARRGHARQIMTAQPTQWDIAIHVWHLPTLLFRHVVTLFSWHLVTPSVSDTFWHVLTLFSWHFSDTVRHFSTLDYNICKK